MNKFFLLAGACGGWLASAGALRSAARPGPVVHRGLHPGEVEVRLDDHERRIGFLEGTTTGSAGGGRSDRTVESAGTDSTYRVRPGDTLYQIARRHGLSAKALAAANRISDEAKLAAGQVLKIPGRKAREAVPPRYGKSPGAGEIRHTVKSGETLYGLSRKYSVSAEELMRLNRIADPARVRPGVVLRIPSPKSGLTAPVRDGTAADPEEPLPPGWKWHVVRQGESLSRIAAHHGLDRRTLESANKLRGSGALQTGRKLKVPPATKASDAAEDPSLIENSSDEAGNRDGFLGYFVLKGDTVESVASQFSTNAETIRRLNDLSRTESLAPGRRIVVPNNGIFD